VDEHIIAKWRDAKERSTAKRAHNREASVGVLVGASIAFELNNGGAHLIVSHTGRVVDFWPGTGLWIARGIKADGRGRAAPDALA